MPPKEGDAMDLMLQSSRLDYQPKGPRAFSLVELLVTIAIIGVLLALLLPALAVAREAARRAACSNHLRQIGFAMQQYESVAKSFPQGRLGCDDLGDQTTVPACPPGLPAEKKTGASGFVSILPQLEQQPLYDLCDVARGGLWNRNVDDLRWYSIAGKRRAVSERPTVYVCPSDSSAAISEVYLPILAATGSYAMNQGSMGPDVSPLQARYETDGLFTFVASTRLEEVTDGLSNTLLAGEVTAADTWEGSNTWTYSLSFGDCLRTTYNALNTQPGDGIVNYRRNGAFGSQHPGGANFAFADGHVRFVRDNLDQRLYSAMATKEGGEIAHIP